MKSLKQQIKREKAAREGESFLFSKLLQSFERYGLSYLNHC